MSFRERLVATLRALAPLFEEPDPAPHREKVGALLRRLEREGAG